MNPGRIPPLPRWLAPVLGAGILLLGFLPLVTLEADSDIAWLIHAAGRVLEGARYGVEVVEVNPPLILWFSMLPVLLARVVPLPVTALYHALVTALVIASTLQASRLLRRHPLVGPAGAAGWCGLLVLAVLMLPAGIAFGQREHLAVVLMLPWLLATGARTGGQPLGPRAAAAAGVVAGLGIALKPYFLAPLLLVELAAWRRGARPGRPESAAIVVTGAAYAALALAIHPEWLDSARRLAPLYRAYLVPSIAQFTAPGTVAIAAFAVLAAVWWILAPSRPAPARWSTPLAAAAAGFALSALLQWKVWPYLFVPVTILSTLALGLLAIESAGRSGRPLGTAAWWIATATSALLGVGIVREGVFWAGSGLAAPGAPGAEHRELVRRVRELGEGRPVAVLSTNHLFSFPLALEVGTGWALRYPSLWPLVAIRRAELEPGPEPISALAAPPDARESLLLEHLAEDLERAAPGVLVVPSPEPRLDAWGYARRFDYEALAAGFPRLAAVLARYRLVDSVGFFRIYASGE